MYASPMRAFACLLAMSTAIFAAEGEVKSFDIAAVDAERALRMFSAQSGVQVVFPTEVVRGITTKSVKGDLTPADAIDQLLSGTVLVAMTDKNMQGAFTVRREASIEQAEKNAAARRASDQAAIASPVVPRATGNAKAQEADDRLNLSPFIVTAEKDSGYGSRLTTSGSRTAKDMVDIGASITVLNRELIEDLNPNDVYQLIATGVSGVTSTSNTIDQFSFRGFVQAFQLRDGGFVRSYKRNPLYDIERVEVIKGPSALAFGNNSFLGGALNFVTQKPTSEFKQSVKVTVADMNYWRVSAGVSGPAYSSKGFEIRYRLTLGMEKGEYERASWYDDNKFVGASVDFQLGANTLVNLTASHYIDDGYKGIDDFLDVTSTVYGKLNQYSTASLTAFSPGTPNVFWNNADSQFALTYTSKLTERGDLRVFLQRAENRMDYMLARWVLVQPNNYTVTRNWAGDVIDSFFYNAQADYLHTLHRGTWSNEFLVGGDWNHLNFYNSGNTFANRFAPLDTRNPDYSGDAAVFSSIFAQFPGFSPAKGKWAEQLKNRASDQWNTNYSYYFQESVKFWNDRINLVSGLRRLTLASRTDNLVTGVKSNFPDKTANTYKHGIVVKPLPNVSLYYSISANTIPPITGILDELGNRIPDRDGELKEAGLKVNRALNERFSLSGAIVRFDMRQTNQRINKVGPNGEPIIEYSALDLSKGWEVDLSGRIKLANGFGDFILTYTKVTSRSVTGAPIRRFPPMKYSVLAKYTWTSGPLRNFMIGGSMVDSDSGNFAGWLLDFPAIYNIFSRYQLNEQWSVQLNLNNITDERYISGIFNNALNATAETFRPRLSVDYKW